MLVIVCASAAEAQAIRKRIAVTDQKRSADALIITGHLCGREMVFVQSGVGPKRAKSAAQYIIDHLNPSWVMLIGAAGAVDPSLKVGDIVIINNILRKEGPIHNIKSTGIFSTCFCDARLSKIASERITQAGLAAVDGDCLTTERFIHLKEKKRWIHSVFNVRVVEMESAALAAAFSAAHIPFINVRIVSDTSTKTIVDYETVIGLKRKSGWYGVARYFLPNPGELIRVIQFRLHMLKVRKLLVRVVTILLTGLPDKI